MSNANFPRPLKVAALDRIRKVWNSSRDAKRKGAAGIDGVRPQKFREDLDRNLRSIHQRLISHDYEFSKLYPIAIPKSSGPPRIICVPTVADRLVQRLVIEYLIEKADKL